jgi:tripartite-type tricarboxylate transporter receptor subunit TctC
MRKRWMMALAMVAFVPCSQLVQNAHAQRYPAKTVRIVVASSAGSGTDTGGRIIAAGLAEVFGQQVIVDNRAGAGGNIGAEMVARAPPDGYTLLHMSSALTANAVLYKSLPYDLVRDFAAISLLIMQPNLLVVHPSLPVRTVGELVRLAKARPGAIDYASGGTGTGTFVGVELFKEAAGVNLLHVPYKGGGPALASLIAGETSVSILALSATLAHVRGGRLRLLAVTSARRAPMLAEYPTVAESGYPGFEFEVRHGLMAPAKTPRETIMTIHGAALAALKIPAIGKRIDDLGYVPIGTQPDEFAAHIKAEIANQGKLLGRLGVKAE